MKVNRLLLLLFSTVIYFLLMVSVSVSQVYRVSTLPALKGKPTVRYPNLANGINNSGEVAGFSISDAVAWKAGGIQDFGQDDCWMCRPAGGINSSGDVTGLLVDEGFVWTAAGGIQILGSYVQPTGINSSDMVTGVYNAGSNTDAFWWTPQEPHLHDLGSFGDGVTWAFGINDSGQIVGFSDDAHYNAIAFVWSESTGLQAIPSPFAGAYSINNQGQVAGADQNSHAAIWTAAGGTQDLGVLPGTSYSFAVAVNNRGVAVGNSFTPPHGPGAVFIWSASLGMLNLNVLANNSKENWTVIGINDAGQIVVNKKGGNVQVLTPIIAVGLTSSQNPSQLGQTVTFTATTSSIAGPPPDGEMVTFADSRTILGTAPLAGGVAQFSTSSLAAGNHHVSATYAGDANYASSKSNVIKQVVNR